MKQCKKCEEVKFNIQMYKTRCYRYDFGFVYTYIHEICISCAKDLTKEAVEKFERKLNKE